MAIKGIMTHTLTLLLFGFLALRPTGVMAVSGDDPSEAVAADMQAMVEGRLAEFFQELGLPPPADIEVETKASFHHAGRTTVVAELDLSVTLVTDHPSEVVREARQTIARALLDRGYRLDSSANDDPRPLVRLTIDRAALSNLNTGPDVWKHYAVFVTILIALVLSIGLFLHLLLWPWRRRWRRRLLASTQVAAQESSTAEATAPRTLRAQQSAAGEEPDLDLRPLPPLPEFAPPITTPTPPSGPGLDQRWEWLRQMPFEKVLGVLAAADPDLRRTMIDQLQLNPPLRRRLEQELLNAPG